MFTIGSRQLMWASSVSYVFLTASYLMPNNTSFLAFTCAWVGLSAGTLWNAQSCYVAACTHILASRSGTKVLALLALMVQKYKY